VVRNNRFDDFIEPIFGSEKRMKASEEKIKTKFLFPRSEFSFGTSEPKVYVVRRLALLLLYFV